MKKLIAILSALTIMFASCVVVLPVEAQAATDSWDSLEVTFDKLPSYTGKAVSAKPTITYENKQMVEGKDYELTLKGATIGTSSVTVKGKGILAGFEKTFYVPVLKSDISKAEIGTKDAVFTAEPTNTQVTVRTDAQVPTDAFTTVYENNVNVGTATTRVIGVGNAYGEAIGTYNIGFGEVSGALSGNYMGQADGTINENFYTDEVTMAPGKFTAWADFTGIHIFACQLKEERGDNDSVVLTEYISEIGDTKTNRFVYDFSSVYEEAAKEGGKTFTLMYGWVNRSYEVYGGIRTIHVPAKVGQATKVTLQKVEKDGDFRQDYFTLVGEDGVVDNVSWTSSDSSVAAVKNGTVTFYKPGKATITARFGNITKAQEVTATVNNLAEGVIFDYKNGKANVIWDNRILEEGVDYTLSVEEKSVGTVVTATGKGLFAGQLEKVFDGFESLADPHTHSYDNSGDLQCNGCGCSRSYVNAVAGDIDGDGSVNNQDVVLLLWNTLFPKDYPLDVDGDITKDGAVNNQDVVYLLWHTLFPKDYPL